MNKDLTWRVLKALNSLYNTGKISSIIASNSYVKYLIEKKLIKYLFGNTNYLVPLNGYHLYYKNNLLPDFIQYEEFFHNNGIESSGRKTYTIEDIKTLIFIVNNREELKKSLTTRRTFSAQIFKYGGSKYLEKHPGLNNIVLQLLDVNDFPAEDPMTLQWRFVVDCPNPDMVVLCENLDFLKMPQTARQHNIELWYVGGNNTKNVQYISSEKLIKPLYYSCDWDYHGLRIYCRLKDIFKEKSVDLNLFFPSNTRHRLPVDSPNHSSLWNSSLDFSGFNKSYFASNEIELISQLIEKNQWIEEESNDLFQMLGVSLISERT